MLDGERPDGRIVGQPAPKFGCIVQARVALARNACRLIYKILVTQQPFDEAAYRRGRLSRGR